MAGLRPTLPDHLLFVCLAAVCSYIRRNNLEKKWFETFFQGAAVEFWNRAVPPALTSTDVTFLERSLQLQPGARVLDVPCGAGRHAIELAKRGYQLTGVDLSGSFLKQAKSRAEESGLDFSILSEDSPAKRPDADPEVRRTKSVDFVLGDMRKLDLSPASFDAAYCFGNSFGYLNRDEAVEFCRGVHRALALKRRFAIDTGCAAESIGNVRQRWHRAGDLVVLSDPRYMASNSRLDIDYTFIQGSVMETRPTSSYVFTAAEIGRILGEAGFAVVAMHGGTNDEPFELGSPRLLITAERRE